MLVLYQKNQKKPISEAESAGASVAIIGFFGFPKLFLVFLVFELDFIGFPKENQGFGSKTYGFP